MKLMKRIFGEPAIETFGSKLPFDHFVGVDVAGHAACGVRCIVCATALLNNHGKLGLQSHNQTIRQHRGNILVSKHNCRKCPEINFMLEKRVKYQRDRKGYLVVNEKVSVADWMQSIKPFCSTRWTMLISNAEGQRIQNSKVAGLRKARHPKGVKSKSDGSTMRFYSENTLTLLNTQAETTGSMGPTH